MHGKEKHEDREFNLLVSNTKCFPLLNWKSQVENIAETKKCLISFCFQSCQEDVSLWFIRVLVQKTCLHSPGSRRGLCDGWGNAGKRGLVLLLLFTSGLKDLELWGVKGIQLSWPVYSLAEPFSRVLDVVVMCALIMWTSAY